MNARLVWFSVSLALLTAPVLVSASAPYTLTYLNSSHDVCSAKIDSSGRLVGQPVRLTSGGGYDSYSVSPDGKWVAGLRDMCGPKVPPGFEWECFIERVGQGRLKRSFRIGSDGEPRLWWSRNGSYLFSWGGQVGGTTRCYDLAAGRKTLETDDCFLDTSSDERHALILEDVGCCMEGPAVLSVGDLRTGKVRRLGTVMFESEYCLWAGKSHDCAFIDTSGNVQIARVSSGSRGVSVRTYRLTSCGHCSDLRSTRSGLYFVQTVSGKKSAYYSSDLTTLRRGDLLAPKPKETFIDEQRKVDDDRLPANAWRYSAAVTADGKLVACPVDAGECKMPQLTVFDKTGRAHPIGRGKMPQWRSAEFSRSYDYLSNYATERWQAHMAFD